MRPLLRAFLTLAALCKPHKPALCAEERENDLSLLSGPEGATAGPAKMLVPKAIDADDLDDDDDDSSDSDDDEASQLCSALLRAWTPAC